MGRPRKPQKCCSSLCRKEIQPWEKGIAVSLFAQTFGMGKQRTSKSQRLYLCPRCAMRTIIGKVPTETAPVDLAFFKIILDLAPETDVSQALAEQLGQMRQAMLYPEIKPEGELVEGEVMPPHRALKAAG